MPSSPLEVVQAAYSFDIPECDVRTVVEGRVTTMAFFIDTAAMLKALAP